ncbi:MAG: T9SS type A sorting domain-containing protein [Bacteroidota bacterium]
MKNVLIGIVFHCLIINMAKTQSCFGNVHSTNLQDSWLSCEKAINPNPNLPNSYWLLYDLGYTYQLNATQFWNFNVKDNTDKGMKNIRIDYSLDGENWDEAVSFQLPEASGRKDYEGVEGPDLGGIQARYVLLSSLDNWGSSNCVGLSEVRFEVGQVTASEEGINKSPIIKIFPNPSQSTLNIETDLETKIQVIVIYDAMGRELIRMPFSANVDIAYLQDGLYFLKLFSEQQALGTASFIKLRQ